MKGPLVGVRVLDIGTFYGGPFGATVLADFGADVIKVELPGAGDGLRQIGMQYRGQALAWLVDGRNKKSITLDMRTPEGRDLLLRLVAISDVLIENFTPGTLERWALGEDVLRAVNPRLVITRVSGYGQEGPYRLRPGFDRVALAYGGVTYLTGYPECPPARPGVAMADYVAGLYNALATLMALYHRDAQQGEGQTVDIALFEGVFRMTAEFITGYGLTGEVRERSGNFNQKVAPGDVFQTRDGRWIMIACSNQSTWECLARAMERPELIDDPRFRTNFDRLAHFRALHEWITAWVATLDWGELEAKLNAHGVPVSLIYSMDDIAHDEHYHARQAIAVVPDPGLGALQMPGIGPRFSKTPGEIRHAGRPLGADNEAVYRDLLGLGADELATLRERGVI